MAAAAEPAGGAGAVPRHDAAHGGEPRGGAGGRDGAEGPAAAARVTMDAAISALKAEREKFAADKRRVQKQSAQELAHELSCGNPSRPRNLHEMLPFEKTRAT